MTKEQDTHSAAHIFIGIMVGLLVMGIGFAIILLLIYYLLAFQLLIVGVM